MSATTAPTKASGSGPTATIRWGAWCEDRDLELWFPNHWSVQTCAPRDGDDIGEEGIAAAFGAPLGTPTLDQLARGRRSPCIVIDDLSRPTRGDRLIPPILDQLAQAGIPPDDVLILMATANHRQMVAEDLRKKLGDSVLERCEVVNHFSWRSCSAIGTTSRGTPVEINDRYLASDLRILVGSIIPHGATGFSGGAKAVMPGVASNRTAAAFHRGPAARGRYADTDGEARADAEEAARMAGVDLVVNSVPTSAMGIAALVVGDLVEAHRAGVEAARQVMATATPKGLDVCVLSLYPKDGEFLQHVTAFAPYRSAPEPLVKPGGSVVVALAAHEGTGFHSLFGPGMELSQRRATSLRQRRLAFFSPGLRPGLVPAAVRSDTIVHTRWEDTVSWLAEAHPGPVEAAVFPCATMQLSAAVCQEPGPGNRHEPG